MLIYLQDLDKEEEVAMELTVEATVPCQDLFMLFFSHSQSCGFEIDQQAYAHYPDRQTLFHYPGNPSLLEGGNARPLTFREAAARADFKKGSEPEYEIDEMEYFTVHIVMLTMSDYEERHVQIAERDFPEGMDEWDALGYIIEKSGAYDGEFVAITYEGYAPFLEILT